MVKRRKRKTGRKIDFDKVKDLIINTCLFNLQKQFIDGGTPDEQVAYVVDEYPDQVAFMTVPMMMDVVDEKGDKVEALCERLGIPMFDKSDRKMVRNSFMSNCRANNWPNLLVSPTWLAANEVDDDDNEDKVAIGHCDEADISKMANRVEIIIAQLWLPGMGEGYDERYAEISRGPDGTEIGELYPLEVFCKMLDKEGRFEGK